MPNQDILWIKGAREHNLQNLEIRIPRDKLTVITGLSGSGKSSLAFDTIYAEGQRRYVESLSAYARQFLGLMEKPDVDFIEGLSPAISIEQKGASKNPRSTVGTVTEVYDYLRLLYARIGSPHCVKCGRLISRQTVEQIVDAVLAFPEGARMVLLAPLVVGKKGEHKDIIAEALSEGYVRLRIDGEITENADEATLNKKQKHTIEAVVDRLVNKTKIKRRLADSVETALKTGAGTCLINIDGQDHLFSESFACLRCGIRYEEPAPRLFSFNSPFGACPTCSGLGTKMDFHRDLVIRDPDLSINQGAISPWGEDMANWYRFMLRGLADHYEFKLTTPFKRLPKKVQKTILYDSGDEEMRFRYVRGSGKGSGSYTSTFEGVVNNLERRYKQTESAGVRQWLEQFMTISACPDCEGSRLKPEALGVLIEKKAIHQITSLSIKDADAFFSSLKLSSRKRTIARQILKEIRDRLSFLNNVGLGYLTLDRGTASLSGGEAQRIRLATQIGSRLVG
ncbi:MAG: excinuclease ABC subunit UvrA, partial [Candidatus Zixiibacteriota bacterium]